MVYYACRYVHMYVGSMYCNSLSLDNRTFYSVAIVAIGYMKLILCSISVLDAL